MTVITTPAPVPDPLSSDFGTKAYAFTQWMATAAPEMNAVASEVNTQVNSLALLSASAPSIIGIANYKGLYSGLSGALATPASTYHLNKFWALTSSLADVTTKIPGTAPEWVDMTVGGTTVIGDLVPKPASRGSSVTEGGGTYLKTGVTALSSTYPSAPATVVGDGTTWATKNVPYGLVTPTAAAYGNGRTIGFNSGTFYWVSDDNCTTFQQRPAPTAMQTACGALAWGYGQTWMWITAAAGGVAFISHDNGDTWTQVTNAPNGTKNFPYSRLVYAAGKWVCTGDSGTVSIAYSVDDGATWVSPTQPAAVMKGIAYGNGVFVALGDSNQAAYTSPDAVTWTTYATAVPVSSAAELKFINGVFVTPASAASSSIYTSTNGQSFTAQTMPSSQTWRGMCGYNGTFFIATNASSAVAATSTNMTSFTARTLSITAGGSGSFATPTGAGINAWRGGTTFSASLTGDASYVNNFIALYADDFGTFPLYMRVA